MDNFEGSVNVEGIDDEVTGTEESGNVNNQEESNQDSGTGAEGGENQNQNQGSQNQGEQKTDKGTKLDPNPQSAVHQELANYKREIEEYRQFMTNPTALKNYIKELETEVGAETGQSGSEVHNQAKEEFVTDPDKIETAEDLRSYTKYLTKQVEDMKSGFKKEIELTKAEAKEKAIADGIASDVNELWGKYPELRPTNADGTANPNFDPVLEKEIADMYNELDKDSKTGKYLGRISIKQIADRFMKIRKTGEATGSKNAQTVVLDKRSGAIKSGGGTSAAPDESKLTGPQLIAARMAKAMKGR